MKHHMKIIRFLFIFLIILICIFTFAGEFFFHYALVRSGEKSQGSKRNIPSTLSDNNIYIIDQNKNNAINKVLNWIDSVEKEKISEISKDNLTLKATKFYHNYYSNKYAIIIHGYSSKKEDFYDIAQNYYQEGFNIISPDLRAHGESEGKYIGMGWLDKDDIKLWINRIISSDNDAKIVIHGVSMGAATAIMTSGESLPENVKIIIEDCGYSSVKDIFSSELKVRFNLPSFPLIESMSVITKIHAKYSILEASCLNQAKKSQIPILILHGDQDNFVSVDMAYQLYNSINAKKDMLIFNGAGHNECRFLEPDTYYKKVFNFIESNI